VFECFLDCKYYVKCTIVDYVFLEIEINMKTVHLHQYIFVIQQDVKNILMHIY